ncbi:MAG: GTPase, partial [Cyanobacteria bacterium J06621_8]
MEKNKPKKVIIFIGKFLEILTRYLKGSLLTIFITSIGLIGSFASIQSHFDSLSSNVDCTLQMSKFDNLIHCYKLIKFKTPFELLSSSLRIIIWTSFAISFAILFYTISIILKNSLIETTSLFSNKYEKLANKIQNLQDIKNVESTQIDKLSKVCLIGTSDVGKSVCLHRLANKEKDPRVTTSPYGIIMRMNSNKYYLVLDAPGKREELQKSNIDFSQNHLNPSILLIFLDHNKSDTDSKIDLNRLLEHEDFLENLKTYLAD